MQNIFVSSDVILDFQLSNVLGICGSETREVAGFDFKAIINHNSVQIALIAPCAKFLLRNAP